MSAFEFSLQAALDLRKREEDAAHRRLGEALRRAESARRDLLETQERHDAILAALRAGRDGSDHQRLACEQIDHAHRYLRNLRATMREQRLRLEQLELQVTHRRSELTEAARERRTLERLSERREAEYRRELARRESRELDEAAATRHARDASEEALPSVIRVSRAA